MVKGLTAMNTKQLAAVGHLLPPGAPEAVGIAARLPRYNQVKLIKLLWLDALCRLCHVRHMRCEALTTRVSGATQGRRRQELTVAKMLRGQLQDGQLEKLQEAVALAADNSGVFEDGEVAGLVAEWRQRLLDGDTVRRCQAETLSSDATTLFTCSNCEASSDGGRRLVRRGHRRRWRRC